MRKERLCGLVGVAVLGMVCSAMATTTTLSPSVVGCMGYCTGVNPGAGWFVAGNASPDANHMFVSVEKYSLSSLSGIVTEATLKTDVTTTYNTTGGANNYFLLQHYTYDNAGDIDGDDLNLNSTSVNTINTSVASVSTYTWDVTSYVASDLKAGFSTSGFRLVLCDANGTPLTDDVGQQIIVFGNPSMSVTTEVPEPVSLVLLGLGGLILRRKLA